MSIETTAIEDLFGSAAPSFFTKDSEPGDTVSGMILKSEIRQVFDPNTRKPVNWASGRPQMQLVVTLVTEDGEEYSLYLKSWGVQRKALMEAAEKRGTSVAMATRPGGNIRATFTGEAKSAKPGQDPTKIYEYDFS